MDLLLNDLSFHGQFPDVASFREAVGRLMAIRQVVPRFGRVFYCHRGTAVAQVTASATMPEIAQALTSDERRALLRWLNQQGPFWEDQRAHNPDDWFECRGEIVTDTAVGEAAWYRVNGIARALVSVTPSNWVSSPVAVDWLSEVVPPRRTEILNFWDATAVAAALEAAPLPVSTWAGVDAAARARFTQLTFTANAFSPLAGYPFVPSAAERTLVLLDTLDRLRTCVDQHGARTAEGHRLYQNHFTGDKAWFSDCSETEKREFARELVFEHPIPGRQPLFCPWHGKVNTPQIRIHFTWPVPASEPLYVVYVGPKITRQ